MSSSASQLYVFGDFRLDVSDRSLSRGGQRVPLSEKAFETLCVLVKRADHLVSKNELLSEVWADTIVEENNLAKNVSLLRKALGVQANGEEFIQTVRGHGFRFVANVDVLSDAPGKHRVSSSHNTNHPLRAVENKGEPTSRTQVHSDFVTGRPDLIDRDRRTVRLFWLFGLVLFALVGVFFIAWDSLRTETASSSAVASVAVLPFANPGGDPEMEYLSDGLSESLIDRLSELPQIRVVARSSSFKYRGENIDLQDAAAKLGVQAIIAGRVLRRGDDLSVRAELLDAVENKQLWGAEFNRKAADLFSVQQEITRIVSDKFLLRFSAPEGVQNSQKLPVNPQAYELVLKGRFLQIKGGIDNLKTAIDYFEQAISIDGTYALAHAILADSYAGMYGPGILDPKEFKPKAQAAARKALELDPDLAEGHRAMANLYSNDWNWVAAEAEYRRAIEINPNFVSARNNYSAFLSTVGRHEEAIIEARRSKDLDPLNIHSHVTVGYTLTHARRYDEAIAELKKVIQLDENNAAAHRWLSAAYSGKGSHSEALAAYLTAIRLGDVGPSGQIYLGAAYARVGDHQKARAVLKQLERGEVFVSPGELPVLYVALGEYEKAFASFEKAYAAHDLQLQFVKIDPSFDLLRGDVRFQDLVHRLGFPQ